MPISDFFSTLRSASARSSASTPASSIGGGRSSARLLRIAAGTVFGRQVVQGRRADHLQHRGDIGLRRADMARDETIGRFQLGQLGQRESRPARHSRVHQSSVSRNSL